jgi:hypothetical protein
MPYDRRYAERRTDWRVFESLERKDSDRRAEERRDSPRVPHRIWVKDPAESGLFHVFDGEVSLGGASWTTPWPPLSDHIEVRFRIPDLEDELCAKAHVIRTSPEDGDLKVQVAFKGMKLKQELAFARYLEAWQAS